MYRINQADASALALSSASFLLAGLLLLRP
jgi:hypothetical protein